jgi:hypothetical protein
LIFKDQEFPSVISIVEYVTSTVLQTASQYIPQSSATPRHTPVPWWTDECRNAIHTRKWALRLFQTHPTFENLISFKHLRAKAQRAIRKAKYTSWKAFVSVLSQSARSDVIWEQTTAYVR